MPNGYITIKEANGRIWHSYIPLTKEAVHEEELMKSDFVRLSWVDTERYSIPAGCYIEPIPTIEGIDGQTAKFSLFKEYQPERTIDGYKYQPEFQHPKMWLGYVPYIFYTQDAAGNNVEKTEATYITSLRTILGELCTFINKSFWPNGTHPADPFVNPSSDDSDSSDVSTEFLVYPIQIDLTQTVSWSFKDIDVLSALDAVAKLCDCEWHIDWDLKLIYFGKIMLGVTPLLLNTDSVDDSGNYHKGNINLPAVTRSNEKFYNAYIVHGSSRNNYRKTENGNIALNTPLTLPSNYPHSILDKREGSEPLLTTVLNIDDIYPQYELYLYDCVERHKYKYNENKELTSEEWSVWYVRLAVRNGSSFSDFKLTEYAKAKVVDFGWRVYDLTTGQTIFSGHGAQPSSLPANSDIEVNKIITDLPFNGSYFTFDYYTDASGKKITEFYTNVKVGQVSYGDIAAQSYRYGDMLATAFVKKHGDTQRFPQLLAHVSVNTDLLLPEVNTAVMPSDHINTLLIDGLVPTLAMQINDVSGHQSNLLGTREFELIYHSASVEFNDADDVEDPQSGWQDSEGNIIAPPTMGYKYSTLPAGYYEIIHKEEGSDKLIVPTTSEQGIYPQGDNDLGANVVLNNKATIFNIAMDETTRETAQNDLLAAANAEILKMELDSNNYTFKANIIEFESPSGNPNLYIGRKVRLQTDGLDLTTRVLKLSTKTDYSFEQEITVGNKAITSRTQALQEQLYALTHDVNDWVAGGTGEEQSPAVQYIEYPEWSDTMMYYFEGYNRAENRLETSRVWHKGCLWECRRTGTAVEPWFGETDWKCLKVADLALQFFDNSETPQPLTVVPVRIGSIDFEVVPYLLLGNEDVTAASIQSWRWTRESFDTASDAAWNALDNPKTTGRNLTITDRPAEGQRKDIPDGYARGRKLEFVCTATLRFELDGEETTIMNRVVF